MRIVYAALLPTGLIDIIFFFPHSSVDYFGQLSHEEVKKGDDETSCQKRRENNLEIQ